jgi:hypothetical protein
MPLPKGIATLRMRRARLSHRTRSFSQAQPWLV